MAAFTIREVSDRGAGEVLGLDCRRELAPDDVAELRAAFRHFPILAIRDQQLAPRQQSAFSRHFGPLVNEENRDFIHPDDPHVLILTNELRPDGSPIGVVDAGDFMHSDSSHRPEPVKATILHAVRNPSRGGETEFMNMHLVYDALPSELRAKVEGRTAFHHVSKLKNRRVAVSGSRPDAVDSYTRSLERPGAHQPMVRTHPETGRPSLYASPRFTLSIDGLEEAASDAILDELFAFIADERFIYRHRWCDGDLVMWDNRCLNHRATGGYVLPDIRRMHRTTVGGDRVFYRPTAA